MATKTRATPIEVITPSQKIFPFARKIGKIIMWLIIITIIAIFVMGWLGKKFAEWEEKERLRLLSAGQQNSSYTQTEKGSVVKVIDTSELVRYKVKVVWGEWIKIGTPSEFKYVDHDWDPNYDSIDNRNRLYKVRLNEDNNLIKTEGLLDGKMTLANFEEGSQRIEFTSHCILLDKDGNPILNEQKQTIRLPVYLIVDYTMKRQRYW